MPRHTMLTSLLLTASLGSIACSAAPVSLEERTVYAPDQQSNSSYASGISFNFTSVPEPQPVRGSFGAVTDFQQLENPALDQQNPDALAGPGTDSGTVYQAKWPLGLSHNRLTQGGWARQQNVDVLPAATQMAGVDFVLKPWAYRELHWHISNEWAYVFNGTCRIASINADGQNFIDDVGPGDLWYFPQGDPHSIQALGDGCSFLLVFDNGTFSEDDTFLITDWLAHLPKEVIAKNFQLPMSDFDNLPPSELYVFPGTPNNASISSSSQNVSDPQGQNPQPFSYKFSLQAAMQTPGGSVKIVDSTIFPASKTIAAALVTINPGAMRELHWHPTSDEWNTFFQGKARITIYAAESNARTFDYQAGDIGYIESNNGHYIENVGTEPVVVLEVLKTDRFTDISLAQWIALTPKQIIKDTLMLPDNVIDAITTNGNKTKQFVV